MSADDSKKEYIRALEQRDQRIDQLKTELENVTRLKNQELANLTQKMEFIMDEKDHQIKVSILIRQPDGLKNYLEAKCIGRWVQEGGQRKKRGYLSRNWT